MCEGRPTSLDHTSLFPLKKSHQKQTDLALRIRREQHDTWTRAGRGRIAAARAGDSRAGAAPPKEALLAAIVESSADAIIGWTLEGAIFSWNVGAEKLFGYSIAEAVGQSIAIIVPPERQVEIESLRRKTEAG